MFWEKHWCKLIFYYYIGIEIVFNFPLNELHCNLWALAVGLTCCFLMQRLTDDGAAQKLPPSGLNTETAQGDALPTVMLLSPSCFTLCAPSKVHSDIFPCLSLSLPLSVFYQICSALRFLLYSARK